MFVPPPEAYVAILSCPPTSRASPGAAPRYETFPLNLTVMLTVCPTPYTPPDAETDATWTGPPSTCRDFNGNGYGECSSPYSSGSASARFAAAPFDRAVMEPPLRRRADVDV